MLDQKLRRTCLDGNFADFRLRGTCTREDSFTPCISSAMVSGKRQIYVPAFAGDRYDPLPTWRLRREQPGAQHPCCLVTCIPAVHRRNTTDNEPSLDGIMATNHAILNPLAGCAPWHPRGTDGAGTLSRGAEQPATRASSCARLHHGDPRLRPPLPPAHAGGRQVRAPWRLDSAADDRAGMSGTGNFGAWDCIMDFTLAIEPLGT
ncbi:MAG: hypothetical protein RMI94_11550 [Bryobacterales bacterium]|nr:hypothetical protein [Bryobacterales bacterium]